MPPVLSKRDEVRAVIESARSAPDPVVITVRFEGPDRILRTLEVIPRPPRPRRAGLRRRCAPPPVSRSRCFVIAVYRAGYPPRTPPLRRPSRILFAVNGRAGGLRWSSACWVSAVFALAPEADRRPAPRLDGRPSAPASAGGPPSASSRTSTPAPATPIAAATTPSTNSPTSTNAACGPSPAPASPRPAPSSPPPRRSSTTPRMDTSSTSWTTCSVSAPRMPLRKLVGDGRLTRHKLAGQFLYCTADRAHGTRQLRARRLLMHPPDSGRPLPGRRRDARGTARRHRVVRGPPRRTAGAASSPGSNRLSAGGAATGASPPCSASTRLPSPSAGGNSSSAMSRSTGCGASAADGRGSLCGVQDYAEFGSAARGNTDDYVERYSA